MWLTSAIWMAAAPARAQTASPEVARAAELYFQGRAVSAREAIVRALDGPVGRDPDLKLGALQMLLDICIASHADDCVRTYADAYLAAARPADDADAATKAQRALSAGYYFDAGRLALGRPEVTAEILDWAPWKTEAPELVELCLRRQILGARVALAQGKPALALDFLDRSLSLVASLEPGGASPFAVAQHLAQAIGLLHEIGQDGRAYGLLAASGGFIADTLPAKSVDGAEFAVTAGSLLAHVGDIERAERMLGVAAERLQAIELDTGTRDRLLGATLTLRAALAAPRGDVASARRDIDAHPFARLYAERGRAPQSRDETAYLAARALVAAVERTPDPVALDALSRPPPPGADREIAVTRAFGRLMLMPPGPERDQVLATYGADVRDMAVTSVRDVPGAWYRAAPLDVVMLALALSGARADGKDGGDLAFSLFQLGSRFGPTFDGDALTALGAARTDADRTAIHRALRLRARRDRQERAAIQAAVGRLATPATGRRFDPAARAPLTDLATTIAEAERTARRAGAPLSGANVTPLKTFQAVLAPDEAALTVAISVGGLEYMCVRRDRAVRFRRNADPARLLLDSRLLNQALTATHAPSEASDVQFPVEAAVRLYGDLIAPFEGCLRPGDRIVWLPAVSAFTLPLAALLPQAPPKLTRGWDLAQADWLVKRHAISYPGSASMVAAARKGRLNVGGGDFLGVGDPLFTGQAAAGQLRGVRSQDLAELTPLPDTKDELEASARGFAGVRLLLQREATEANVRRALAAQPWRYISFATHGLIRDDLQGLAEPALALTPGGADPADDGLLTATEIADLSLSARFVALSACNTANFDLSLMARDLPALASAFALAGVPSTLGTLWPVNTETGRAVVADVFARLRADPRADPALALAEAQRAFLAAPPGRAYLHPRFWAPFVVLGDAGGG